MSRETATLAEYAVGLSYDDIPTDVVARAKDCIIDTVAVTTFSSSLPWSRTVAKYAESTGPGGRSTILGPDRTRVTAPMAALANGAMAHGFEMDCLRQPSVGIHAGATVALPGLAVAEDLGASGKELVTAFVAGNEVLSRVGLAGQHSSEQLGFHAPGLTGPIGSAVIAGRLMGLDAGRMTCAMGIAGSLSSGLLEFIRSGTGGMVKRLHLGRAAEGGVMAASLARDGFTGPETVLEGEFGFLNVFCRNPDPSQLTKGLGEIFETRNICLKRFSCHITAHTPVQAILDLKAEHGFSGDDVESITVHGSKKMATHHDIAEPADVMLAQYSTRFCVAVAMLKDPLDPTSFMEASVEDEAIRDLCRRSRVVERTDEAGKNMPWATIVDVALRNGRTVTKQADTFMGMPVDPVSREDLSAKFMRLTSSMEPDWQNRVRDALFDLENYGDVSSLL